MPFLSSTALQKTLTKYEAELSVGVVRFGQQKGPTAKALVLNSLEFGGQFVEFGSSPQSLQVSSIARVLSVPGGFGSDTSILLALSSCFLQGSHKPSRCDVLFAPEWYTLIELSVSCKQDNESASRIHVALPDPPGTLDILAVPETVRLCLFQVYEDALVSEAIAE